MVTVHGDFTVATWVDDCICRGSEADTEWFYREMAKRFDVKDPSYLTPESPLVFVGMDMTVKSTEVGLVYGLNQNGSVRAFLDEHGVSYNTGVKCPLPDVRSLYEQSEFLSEEAASEYRSMIGTLNYFAIATRYDIAHAVSILSQFSANPTVSSAAGVKRVMQYLSGASAFSLEAVDAPGNLAAHKAVEGVLSTPDRIENWSDSNHGGERPGTTLSQTGIIITLNGAPVHWSSRKQVQGTAYSSALAEVYALSDTVRAGRLYAWRCEEMGMVVTWPLVVQVDSSAAVSFQRSTCLLSRIRARVC